MSEITELNANYTDYAHHITEAVLQTQADLATLKAQIDTYQVVEDLKTAANFNPDLPPAYRRRPMWQHVPTSEQWQSRNKSARIYLYLRWRRDRATRTHQGPNGSRKTYVGRDPNRQALARRMVQNRRDYITLTDTYNAQLRTFRTMNLRLSQILHDFNHRIEQTTAAISMVTTLQPKRQDHAT